MSGRRKRHRVIRTTLLPIRTILILVVAGFFASGCSSCDDETNAVIPDVGSIADFGESDMGEDVGPTPDDVGNDVGAVQRPNSPVVLPLAGGGKSSSSQHKLRLRIGQPTGDANTPNNRLKLGGTHE